MIRHSLIFFKTFLWTLCIPILTISCSNIEKVFVVRVIDGDTFVGKNDNRFRLFGVDTPEIFYDETEAIENPLKHYYSQSAKIFVEQTINEKDVQIERIEKDIYNRTISKWFLGNKDIGILLIELGLARVFYISTNPKDNYYTSDFGYYEKLINAQKKAFDNQVGIWEDENIYKQIF